MSEYTKDLISAIAAGDATGTEISFNHAMAEKVSAKLETMQQEVARNMFNTHQEEAVIEDSESNDDTQE